MTVVLELKPEIEEKLRRRATARGQKLDGYLLDVIERDADEKQAPRLPKLGLREGKVWTSEDFDAELSESFWLGKDK